MLPSQACDESRTVDFFVTDTGLDFLCDFQLAIVSNVSLEMASRLAAGTRSSFKRLTPESCLCCCFSLWQYLSFHPGVLKVSSLKCLKIYIWTTTEDHIITEKLQEQLLNGPRDDENSL